MTQVVKSEVSPQYVTQAEAIEAAVIGNDLSKLSPEQRVTYYKQLCQSLDLNWLTRPFGYLMLNGKLTLYANKDAAEQLRKKHSVSVEKPDIRFEDDWIIVTVAAHDGNGRTDSDIGVVGRKEMQGNFGNALMKAVTKAKRRVTLSICGLGMLDETEVDSIPDAQTFDATAIDAPTKPAHWIDDDRKRKTFWFKAGEYGLDEATIKRVTGLAHIHDWQGTAQELLDKARELVNAKSEQTPAEQFPEEVAP